MGEARLGTPRQLEVAFSTCEIRIRRSGLAGADQARADLRAAQHLGALLHGEG